MLGGTAVPYANNQGVRIYYEVRGFGLPLVLHHGTLGTGRDWNNFGYTSVLAHKHQLLLIDARGTAGAISLTTPMPTTFLYV
jgi:pimeloyl-ACP methyl ester carboxylesterase